MALALYRLERILTEHSAAEKVGSSASLRGLKRSSSSFKRLSALKGLRQGSISDSDYADADLMVPSADVALDNSKILHRSASEVDINAGKPGVSKYVFRDRDNWRIFKSEILRLIHTLGLKGWRRIPLENGGDIDVARLSGALTNAVYVVSPPKNLPRSQAPDSLTLYMARNPPP
jgi:choline kinase